VKPIRNDTITTSNIYLLSYNTGTSEITYKGSSLITLSTITTFSLIPFNSTYTSGTCDVSSFGTTYIGSGQSFPVNAIPVGYFICSDDQTLTAGIPPYIFTIQVVAFPSTVLATSTGLTFVSGSASNYSGTFTNPIAAPAGTAYVVQMNVNQYTANSKKMRVIIYFAQW